MTDGLLLVLMMIKSTIIKIKRKLGLIPRDWSVGGYDFNQMMASNNARTEESGINNSRWAPGALKRLRKKERKLERQAKKELKANKNSIVFQAEQKLKKKTLIK